MRAVKETPQRQEHRGIHEDNGQERKGSKGEELQPNEDKKESCKDQLACSTVLSWTRQFAEFIIVNTSYNIDENMHYCSCKMNPLAAPPKCFRFLSFLDFGIYA